MTTQRDRIWRLVRAIRESRSTATRDAARMVTLTRTQGRVNSRARQLLQAGVAGGVNRTEEY